MTSNLSSIEIIEEKIKKILEFVETIPEPYRLKCFEILANKIELDEADKVIQKSPEDKQIAESYTSEEPTLPFSVKAFLSMFKLPENVLKEIFIFDYDHVSPIYKIKTVKKTIAQIQLSLLLALENALKPNGEFVFSIEEVRKRCKEEGCYDSDNFNATFKKNIKLFKSLDDKDHVILSPKGKEELSETIVSLTK